MDMGKTAVGILVKEIVGDGWERETIEFPLRFIDGQSLGPAPS